MAGVTCPRCGKSVNQLEATGKPNPPEACASCVAQMNESGNSTPAGSANAPVASPSPSPIVAPGKSLSQGSILMLQEKNREKRKAIIWKSRVAFVRQARQQMTDKAFSDAAVSYEKYIRALEIVFDTKPGELTPEKFKESARTKELTVVSSVYWDLVRIYDTSSQYGERMALAAKKLSQFLRLTPIYSDIIRKANIFLKSAKHPAVIKTFLKNTAESKGQCFIATAAFESPTAPEVSTLRSFRDAYLEPSLAGRAFIQAYYRVSPPLAELLRTRPKARWCVRTALNFFIRVFHLEGKNGTKF